jgi:hypothetical protein
MTLSKLYEEAARVAKLIENTPIKMPSCIKHNGRVCTYYPQFNSDPSEYEFCLAIVENKPVFKGDVLWNVPNNFKFTADKSDYIGGVQRIIGGSLCAWLEDASWSKPKPKTVIVELLREDAEAIASLNADGFRQAQRVEDACRKALEE